MMKNKKLMIVCILVIAFVLLMTNFVKASSDLPILNIDTNDQTNDQPTNNNEQGNNQNVNDVTNTNNNANAGNNTLPQTGVAGDTTLFIFIAICIGSAVYAYLKIRKYNNIH